MGFNSGFKGLNAFLVSARTLYGTWQLAKDPTKYPTIHNRNLPYPLIRKLLS